MTTTRHTIRRTDSQRLEREVTAYLAAVDAFREEGCEPSWSRERHLAHWWLEGSDHHGSGHGLTAA